MQYRPTADELLEAIATLLEDEVLGAVSGPLQHRVRVAAHLTRMIQREIDLAPANDTAERARLAAILGVGDAQDPADPAGDLVALRAQLAERLADPAPIEPAALASIHAGLLATTTADLAISKPGYADWTAES